jgi:DNA-binding NarL/FixJ family response regulator
LIPGVAAREPLAVPIALLATIGLAALGQPWLLAIAGGVAVLAVHLGSAFWLASRPPVAPDEMPAAADWKQFGLTRRQAEVAPLLVRGLSSREIAGRFFNSERTIENHARNIYARLGVHSKAELIAFAARHGLLVLGDAPDRDEAQK